MTERIDIGGITNTRIHLESDGVMHIEERQDCQAILDLNARKRNERFGATSPQGGFQQAFDIPMVLALKWQRECGAAMLSDEHMAYMNRKLNEPEFAYLSTAPTLRDPHVVMRGAR